MSWRATTFTVWALLAAAAIVLWLLAVAGRAGVGRPGPLLLRVFSPVARRCVLLVVWMWLGWHLFAR
jgi:hypothetical protein